MKPAEHARIFSAPMVRALRAGTKTMTRRMVTRLATCFDDGHAASVRTWEVLALDKASVDPKGYLRVPRAGRNPLGEAHHLYPRVRPGDLLWVKESWRPEERASDMRDGIRFAADDAFVGIESTHDAADRWVDAYDNGKHGPGWRSPLFLPRWASRLTLDVTAVRFERLLDLTEEDARAEGVEATHLGEYTHPAVGSVKGAPYRHSFFVLWRELNGEAAWASNPWVTVTSFTVRQNGER